MNSASKFINIINKFFSGIFLCELNPVGPIVPGLPQIADDHTVSFFILDHHV